MNNSPILPDVSPGMNYAEAQYVCDALNLNHGENGELFDANALFLPSKDVGISWGIRIENAEPGERAPELSAEALPFIRGYAEGAIWAIRNMRKSMLERAMDGKEK